MKGWRNESYRHKMSAYGLISCPGKGPLLAKEDAISLSKSLTSVGLLVAKARGKRQYTEEELKLLKKAEKYFHLNKHNMPFISEMMDNPDYYENKKGKRWDIIVLTISEYEKAIKQGFEYESRNIKNAMPLDNVRGARIDPENLKRIVGIMKKEKMSMPHLEYDYTTHHWTGEQYISFSQEGHHRAVAAERVGLKSIPVIVIYPTDAKEFYGVSNIIPKHILSKTRGPILEANGNNIKQIVNDPKWQRVRVSLKGSWKNENGANKENLKRLDAYLGNYTNKRKLRQVHNYLGALRGVKDNDIVKMREKVKKVRSKNE
jgi:hypothetical protein